LDEFGQSQQISHPKGCSTSSHDHIRIRRSKAGPGRWQRPYTIWRFVKRDTIFTPIMAVVEDLELLAIQRMKGMGDCEYSFL